MKILVIEDIESKRAAVVTHLKKGGVPDGDILLARNMTDFAAQLSADIDLFIIDFKLPNLDDGAVAQNGKAILEAIVKAGKHDALLLAISSYPSDFPDLRDFYESRGCILSDFANAKGWQSTLDHLLAQRRKSLRLEFVIFCALQVERNPYTVIKQGKQVTRSGIDCYDFEIGLRKGTAVLLPQMGLVNASITAALCIDRFKPTVVGMSGICGGFKKRAQLGQLFVSSMAYEYQSGKWISDGFLHEPYQVPTDHMLLTELKVLTSTSGLIAELEDGFNGDRPTAQQTPQVGIFCSGSAVIADQKYMDQIEQIHRRVNALDMEVFGIQRAVELSAQRPGCICAKTVVDLGDKSKGDSIHAYGSYIAAKYLIRALEHVFRDESGD